MNENENELLNVHLRPIESILNPSEVKRIWVKKILNDGFI